MSHADHTLRQRLRQQLQTLQESGGGTDWLRELVEWLVQELLELEFSEFLGAEPYERNEGRQGYRNGFRERELFTRVGRLTLRVPYRVTHPPSVDEKERWFSLALPLIE